MEGEFVCHSWAGRKLYFRITTGIILILIKLLTGISNFAMMDKKSKLWIWSTVLHWVYDWTMNVSCTMYLSLITKNKILQIWTQQCDQVRKCTDSKGQFVCSLYIPPPLFRRYPWLLSESMICNNLCFSRRSPAATAALFISGTVIVLRPFLEANCKSVRVLAK